MIRSICKWIAVVSLVGLGLSWAAVRLIEILDPSVFGTSTSSIAFPRTLLDKIVDNVLNVTSFIQRTLFPIAALSSAAYILLIDRAVREAPSRGFDVQMK